MLCSDLILAMSLGPISCIGFKSEEAKHLAIFNLIKLKFGMKSIVDNSLSGGVHYLVLTQKTKLNQIQIFLMCFGFLLIQFSLILFDEFGFCILFMKNYV